MKAFIPIVLFLTSSPALANIQAEISDHQASFREKREIQLKCEEYVNKFSRFNRWNYYHLERAGWDRPDGFVDPSLINRARYFFQDQYGDLRDEIDRIQRSDRPTVVACADVYRQAVSNVRDYTKELLITK